MEEDLKKAQKFIKSGNSDSKKGFFSGPDFPSAGSNFFKAAEIYMKHNMYNEAISAAEKSAVAYDKGGLPNNSGKSYGVAANAAMQLNDFAEVKRLLQECSARHFEGNQPLQAVRTIKEITIKTKAVNKKEAFNLYDIALSIVENAEKYVWEKESFVDAAILSMEIEDPEVKFKAWKRAETAFKAMGDNDSAAHCIVSSIALHLKDGDIVAAQRELDEAMQDANFVRTEDYGMIDFLLRGVKNHDGDLVELAQKNVIIGFLKPEIARVICSFKAPKKSPEEGKMGEPSQAVEENNAEEEGDDEMDLL